jgi:hypothetical protein
LRRFFSGIKDVENRRREFFFMGYGGGVGVVEVF